MPYVQWNSSLNTGIDIIDTQHRRIVDYINRLHDANERGDRDEIDQVFEELIDYAVSHFMYEENLQEKAGYGFVVAHQRAHQAFTRKVEEYKERYDAGDHRVTEQVSFMLRAWLLNHIQQEDAAYVLTVKRYLGTEEKTGWWERTKKRLVGG